MATDLSDLYLVEKKCDLTAEDRASESDLDAKEKSQTDDATKHKTPECHANDAYKNKHKIGSRKASEAVITYNEPIYQSLVSTMFEKRKLPRPNKRPHDSDSDDSKSESVKHPKKLKKVEFNRSISLDSGMKKGKKSDKKVNKKAKEQASFQDHIPVAYRRTKREASLNASKLVNILYEKDFPKAKNGQSGSLVRRTMSESDSLYLQIKESEIKEDSKPSLQDEKCLKTKTPPKKSPKTPTMFSKEPKISSKAKKSPCSVKQTSSPPQKKMSSKHIELDVKKVELISKEEGEEKRKRANLARLKKAKELLKKGKIQQEKAKQLKLKNKTQDRKTKKEGKTVQNSNRTDTCRAARTHVIVTPKRINYGINWCECCRPSFFRSSQGSVYWTNTDYMEHSSSKPPEQPKPASSGDASLTVAETSPYGASVVQMVENTPYIAPIVTHGPISGCTSCSCGGVLSGTQCQNFTLGGVGSLSNMQMMSCHQAYNSAFPVAYPHSRPSFTHCGCSSCCSSGTYHSSGSPIIHQSLPTEPARILHHPVHLQMPCTGESPTHTVQLQLPPSEMGHALPCSMSHADSSRNFQPIPLSHSENSHSLPRQLAHSDAPHSMSMQIVQGEASHMGAYAHTRPEPSSHPLCLQISHGEAVNVTFSQSATQVDHDAIIDVGKEEIVIPESVFKPKKKRKQSDNDSAIASKLKIKGKLEEILKKSKKIGSVKTAKNKPKKVENFSGKKTDKEKKMKEVIEKGKNNENVSEKTEKKIPVEKKKMKKNWHGWHWDGEGEVRTVINVFDGKSVQRKCFTAIRHDDGEIIRIRDCILVCSGHNKKDDPYVAKVTSFWEDLDSEEMMMTLLWYYRPEHTETGRKPYHKDCELFAAKHRDEASVACIDDKGYVLTYNEYCRYMAEVARSTYDLPARKKVVPDLEEGYPSHRMPPVDVDPENVFLCRQVYDFKLKRILKNPS